MPRREQSRWAQIRRAMPRPPRERPSFHEVNESAATVRAAEAANPAARLPTLPGNARISAADAAWLVQSLLDSLWVDDQGEGCCNSCCGPCSTLNSLLEKGTLDELANGNGRAEENGWWVNGQVDREFLRRAWRRDECHHEPSTLEWIARLSSRFVVHDQP